jgi:hypothetical protein
MAKAKAAGRDWEKIWGTVWYNLLHALGVAAVLAIVVAIVWSLVSDSTQSVSSGTSTARAKANLYESEARQIVFSNNLMRETAPCARKTKDGSDVSGCSVFGLRPGMSYEQVKQVIDSSGYFSAQTILTEQHEKPAPGTPKAAAAHSKDGLYLGVEFVSAPPEDAAKLKASNITLTLGPGANPYFDAKSMRPLFVKLFGAPDVTTGDSDEWGLGSAQGIRAYVYKESYWVIFSLRQ